MTDGQGWSDTTCLAAGKPLNESARLAALRSYGILDTPVEAAFEDITRIAAHVCRAPIALINLIDASRQWFKSEVGMGVDETPLETSICSHAILQADFLEIPDILCDDRFNRYPMVIGSPYLRFYAGAVLKTSEGHALGTICVLDTQPRALDDAQRAVLRALARQTMAQLELRRALAIADRAHQYRSRLVAVAGHDLRQPLSVMTMVIDEMRRKSIDALEREQLTMAGAAADQLADGLNRLAHASRVDDLRPPDTQVMSISEIFHRVRDTWDYIARRKGLQLSLVPCEAAISSNAEMLQTILDNLVGNAIKYTQQGRVVVACHLAEDMLEIRISDTGCGIPARVLGKIFEAFQQLDPTSEGLGLGLSIVQRTADLLGHSVRVTSEPGTGSTFSVIVPLAPASLAKEPA
ncbi:MAG: GAF domain-containing sensor histidine kinase [Luteimonas sp.]